MDEKSRDERQNVEYVGKTLSEALKRAADDLGISIEELEYEVIRDSTHSILGLVRTGEVVIRVWKPSPPPGEPEPGQPTLGSADEAELKEELPVPVTPSKSNPPELEAIAVEVASTLLDKMGVLAAVEVADRGGVPDPVTNEVSPLVLNVVGDDLGVLIGRRGETLDDLQFILRLIVSRKLGSWPNIVLDVENYKAKRVHSLRALALRMADQVRQTKRGVALEPMPAHERRIIHLALRDDPDVYTESTGEGESRKVQILPK